MNSNQENRTSLGPKWGTVAFIAYCGSTIFMMFFSTTAIQIWSPPWNRFSILFACLLPLFLVLVWKIPHLIRVKELEKQLLFIPFIIILGILNIIFSEDRPTTLKVMTLFLISGIGVFFTTNYLLNTKFRQTFFLWLCWLSLLVFCLYGILLYINKEKIYLLSHNPIPAGSLLLLLFIGPLLLFLLSSRWLRFLQLSSIVFAIALIVMIGTRGTLVAILVMSFLFGTLLRWKMSWMVPLIALMLIGIGYMMKNHLPSTLTKNLITAASTLYRLENYPFAAHIFFQKPLFGIGLHAPLTEYLQDYRQIITKNGRYPGYIQKRKTLENIILCGFVEMGGLFTITYIALIIYLLSNLFFGIRGKPEKRVKTFLFLIPLTGFFIHSMTYDSLIYPHLNWLFHSFLGLMANFDKT